jgi:hypothetical protein
LAPWNLNKKENKKDDENEEPNTSSNALVLVPSFFDVLRLNRHGTKGEVLQCFSPSYTDKISPNE